MKINKRLFVLRLITFPIKLTFTVLWSVLIGLKISIQWLINGSQELYFGADHDKSLVALIENTETIVENMKKL